MSRATNYTHEFKTDSAGACRQCFGKRFQQSQLRFWGCIIWQWPCFLPGDYDTDLISVALLTSSNFERVSACVGAYIQKTDCDCCAESHDYPQNLSPRA